MVPFAAQYAEIFDRFGYPLGATHGVDEEILDRASARLGGPIPDALRSYYSVAGKEKRFNRAFQQFLPPPPAGRSQGGIWCSSKKTRRSAAGEFP